MMLINPLKMNDWEFSKFFKFVIIFQITLLFFAGLNLVSIHVPILGEFIAFIYLLFIPGVLILRILRIHKLGSIETVLYAVGLSIATLMFAGFFMNMIYPLFGIKDPISLIPLIITMSIFVLSLCVLSYMRDKNFSNPDFIDTKDLFNPTFLFLCLIPFLAIFGTYLMRYNYSIVSMILIVIIALIAILVAFDKIPKKYYSFTVFIIAISLLYYSSLISTQIWGYDIQHEYYLANLVLKNLYWDYTLGYMVNSMLSVVMLAPIYSIISNMSLTWVFKVIYPLIFSLVPLGLYNIFKKQTGPKIAFFACFFFMSFITFYMEMVALAREEIGEVFLIALIMLMIDTKTKGRNRIFLFAVFGSSLIVSHYGLTYLYIFALIIVLMILFFIENPKTQKIYFKLVGKMKGKVINPQFPKAKDRKGSLFLIIFFIAFTIIWYICISSSANFVTILELGNSITGGFLGKFLSSNAAQGASQVAVAPVQSSLSGLAILMSKTSSWVQTFNNYLIAVILLFISVGIILSLFKRIKAQFIREYKVFAIASFIILLLGLLVPSFAGALNMSRIYQITFIFLSPFCVIGGIKVFEIIISALSRFKPNLNVKKAIHVFSIFLVIFLLFNTGFVGKIVNKSVPIQLNSVADFPRFNGYESSGAEWLGEKKIPGEIYADQYGELILIRFNNFNDVSVISIGASRLNSSDFNDVHVIPDKNRINPSDQMENGSYIYFRTINVKGKALVNVIKNGTKCLVWAKSIENLIENRNQIYDNGFTRAYINVF